jgi:YHYH protein
MRWQFASLAATALSVLLTACGSTAKGLPAAPLLWWSEVGSASVKLHFAQVPTPGAETPSSYSAQCQTDGAVVTATAEHSPVTVTGLANNTVYRCELHASNSSGSSSASRTVAFMPIASPEQSLAEGYRKAHWAPGVTVTFENECRMAVWSDGLPRHPTEPGYLQPVNSPKQTALASTPLSGIPLAVESYEAKATRAAPVVFDICPVRAANHTATQQGMVGLMISGAVLFGAGEIPGHRATAFNDNVSVPVRSGVPAKGAFLDSCNGHPTPRQAGAVYHYHGLSHCLSDKLDEVDGPSHLLGIALDGYPIYGDRDLQGKRIEVSQLDACNGITSPTPEFPHGVYHYVLPEGATEAYASLRCLSAAVSPRQWAVARSSGFCYTALTAGSPAIKHEDLRRD